MKKLNAYYEKLFKQLKIKKGDKIVVHSNLFTFGFNSPKLPKVIIRNLKLAVGFGGGYGGLARMICNNKNCTYILIDLPVTTEILYKVHKNSIKLVSAL